MTIQLADALTPLPPIAEDPGPPYLLCDLYPLDLDDPHTPQLDDPPWEKAFASNPKLCGVILKAWDGTAYGQAYADWFVRNFRKLGSLYDSSRGMGRFRGGYLYAEFFDQPVPQAAAYLTQLEHAGWDQLDIVPIVDVERGSDTSRNAQASAQQIIDSVTSIVEWLEARTGRSVMLYGRGLLRDKNVNSKMGCDRAWDPAYTETIVTNGLVTLDGKAGPWTLDEIVLWQYGGDGVGVSRTHHLPLELVGFGKVDMSVVLNGAKPITMAITRSRLL